MYSVYAELRDKMGVKDSDVARTLGFPPSTFSDWKKGKSSPKYEKLKMIADYFDVSVEYLTTGEQPKGYYLNEETSAIAQEMYDRQGLRRLFDSLRRCSDEQLMLIQKLADSWENKGDK